MFLPALHDVFDFAFLTWCVSPPRTSTIQKECCILLRKPPLLNRIHHSVFTQYYSQKIPNQTKQYNYLVDTKAGIALSTTALPLRTGRLRGETLRCRLLLLAPNSLLRPG